jgi:tetratricopeptide (TPR) repeat protein
MKMRNAKYDLFLLIALMVVLMVALMRIGADAQRVQSAQDPNLLAAESYLKQQNYAKAIEALDLVFRFQPRPDAKAYLMLAACHSNLGAKERAIEAIESGIAAHPASVKIAEYHAALLEEAIDAEMAKAKLRDRIRQQPRVAPYQKALARLLLRTEPSAPATAQTLKQLSVALPLDAEARYLYGQWACLNEHHKLCVSEMGRTLKLAPLNTAAHMQIYTLIALAEVELNHPARAHNAFRRALAANRRLDRFNPLAAHKFVEFLARQNREDEAQSIVDEILKGAPQFAPARLERARWLAKKRQYDLALAEANLALKDAGEDRELLRAAHALLARTYFAAGRPEEAKPHQQWIEMRSQAQ